MTQALTTTAGGRFRLLLLAAFMAGAFAAAPARAEDAGRQIKAALDHAAAAPQDRELKRFYELRHFRPAWASPQAAAAANAALEHAGAEGLIAADYPPEKTARPANAKAAAAWDIDLTRAFLHYAKDVRLGRVIPAKVYEDVALPAQSFDASAELEAALDNGSLETFIAALPPSRPEYVFLRTALAHYRDVDARGDESVPILAGESLASLTPDVREKLARRLAAEDSKPGAEKPETSDAALQAAIRRFQGRFGLEQTGRLTADTLKLLKQPVSDRILQLEANMERWRWLPRDPDKRYVEVNIPAASLKVVADGDVVLNSPVVLGSGDWATPLLATTAQAVVVNPPWHVPPDLAGEEILPKLKKDPSYLATHNMVLLNGPANDPHGRTINWRDVPAASFPYLIQQQPGPHNGLGGLLIDMPNNFGVYLHDTPDKEAFAQAGRLLSHGCVRVRDIAAVASFALYGDTKHADRIPHPPRTETQRVAIDQPLPVYMLYWTAFKDGDGAVDFRRDAYGLDVRLVAALYGKTNVANANAEANHPAVVAAQTSDQHALP